MTAERRSWSGADAKADSQWRGVCAVYTARLDALAQFVKDMQDHTDWSDPTGDALRLEELATAVYEAAMDVYVENK